MFSYLTSMFLYVQTLCKERIQPFLAAMISQPCTSLTPFETTIFVYICSNALMHTKRHIKHGTRILQLGCTHE